MPRGAALTSAISAALVLAVTLLAVSDTASAQQSASGGTVELDVRVWQHVHDPLRIYVSARPEGGRWDTLGTVRVLLDDGVSRSGIHRYGDVAVADVEVRVWQDVGNPLAIHISARGPHDDWTPEPAFRLHLDDGLSPSHAYRYGDASVSVPTPPPHVAVSPGGEEVPPLAALTITFRDPPLARDGGALVSIDPPVEGSFVWIDDRTLLVQPAYPGWSPGQDYVLVVGAGASGLREDYEHRFTAEGALEVSYIIPGHGDAEVPVEAQILVQFNRSVVPLTVLQEGPEAALLEFEPPLPGEGEWLNTSLYRFLPSALEPGTTYSVRIPAELTPRAVGALASDYTWRFSTIRPAVTAFDPHDGALFVEPDTRLRVTFNQPMDRASVEAGLVLREAGGLPVAASFTWSRESTAAVLEIAPDEPLGLGTSYEVIAPAGLRSANGGATRPERIARFTTVDPPRVTGTSPADGETGADCCAVSIDFNNPMDEDSFEGRIFVNGTVLDGWQLSVRSRAVVARWILDYSSEYTVRIAEGVRDRGGRALPPYEFSFVTGPPPPPPALDPALNLIDDSALWAWPAAREPTVQLFARHVAEVRFRLYLLPEQEAESVLREDRRYQIPPPEGEPIREWTEAIPRESHTASTPLGGGEPLPPGHYLVSADAAEVVYTETLLVSVVDTTIFTKLAQDELLVWALDYETGEPLAETEALAGSPHRPDPFSRDDGPPERATTDADGLARFPIAAASGPERISYPDYLVRIVEGGRTGVAVTWWDGDRSLHAPGVPVAESFPALRGHLYTDRPIYRPGETVRYGGVVRAEDDAAYSLPGPGRALSLEVRGPSHAPPEMTAQADELGAFSGELVLPADAVPGTYRIRIPGGRRGQIAETTFTVAEFRVPEFAVEAEASRTDVVAGEQIPVEARARFYFGPPVADAAVSWAALASPTRFLAEGYEGYSFSRYDRGEGRPFRASGTAQTDGSGLARFHAPAALEPGEGTHRFTISATVTDRNAQAVASSTEVTVHPATWYAGISTDSYVAAAGRPQAIHLVSVDTGGRAAPHRPITVRILARDYREGVPHDTEIGVLSATTDERGEASVAFTPLATGEYRLVAESVDGQGRVARAERYLWVSGRDHASWRPRDDNRIELVADRDRYEVGDVAEVLVPAPFAGATGLVTIERGRVLESEVRRFETNSEVLHIPIEAGHVPNVYVGVLLYLPPRGENPRPEFRVGYVNLPVSTAAVELDVRVEPERDRAAPGETVRYEVEVTDSEGRGTEAEVSVAIVDEAVLALAADLGPDGLGAFWYERALGVRTASSLAPRSRDAPRHDDGLYDGDAMDDAGPPEGDRHPPPAGAAPGPHLRSEFRHTALWIGRLSTGPDGKASFELALPDNATTWRARARAVGPGTTVGEGESELLVTQPLLVRPALPRFLRIGDELMLRTLVHNRTAEVRDVTVAIEAEGVVLDRDAALTRRVEPGRSALFAWPARALREGTATVRFLATASGGAADAAELLIPVHLDVTAETIATGGVVEETPAVEALYLPDYAITDRGSLELSVEASLIGALDAELHHFSPSDGESIVEIASRIVATVAVERAGAGALTEARATQLETDIETLVGLQRGGGWAWCRGCTRTDMWVTGWVLFALGEARGAGYAIPQYVYDRASGLITGFVERETDIERPGNPDQHAFLLYALASVAAGGSDTAAVAGEQAPLLQGLLDEHRAGLTSWGRAYLLLGLLASGHEAGHAAVRILINDLSAAAIASANGNHWEDERIAGSMHNSSVRATALVLRALAGVDPGHPLIDETIRWLVTARSGGRWGTSVERAEGMASLGAVAALTGETRGAYDYRVLLNTRLLLSGRFDVPKRDYAEAVAVPLDELPPGEVSRVHLEREAGGEGRMYYGLNLRYVTPSRHIGALNRGFAVSHRYTLLDDPGRVITSASPGDIVRVTVTVVASADRLFARVEDFLPAGLEPIDPELAVVSARVRQQLDEDQRQARLGGAPSDFAPWYRWYYSPWDQVHLRDDRVVLLADRLPRGVHEYVYYARATTPGDFFVSPARAQEAYFPEVFGRSDSSRFSVVADE